MTPVPIARRGGLPAVRQRRGRGSQGCEQARQPRFRRSPVNPHRKRGADVSRLTPLAADRTQAQFDGWAVADSDGKTAGAIAKSFLREMCEGEGREGSEEILAGSPDM